VEGGVAPADAEDDALAAAAELAGAALEGAAEVAPAALAAALGRAEGADVAVGVVPPQAARIGPTASPARPSPAPRRSARRERLCDVCCLSMRCSPLPATVHSVPIE
jgi:hypothetical protein